MIGHPGRVPHGGPGQRLQHVRLPVVGDAPEADDGVVLEEHGPPVLLCPAQQAPLALQRRQRLDVVPHDPGEREVRARRDDVAEEAEALLAAGDEVDGAGNLVLSVSRGVDSR